MSNTNVYVQIASAVEYLCSRCDAQPNLQRAARAAGLTQQCFQHLFTEWIGASPDEFMQHTTTTYNNRRLAQGLALNTAQHLGNFAASIEQQPNVYIAHTTSTNTKRVYKNMTIYYYGWDTPFGLLHIANCDKGICYAAFVEHNDGDSAMNLQARYPHAVCLHMATDMQAIAAKAVCIARGDAHRLPLALFGTPFQLKVWEALLSIPFGALTSYGALAQAIALPKASRAIGRAIGRNPIACLVPCHRVVQSSGGLGGYMWGTARKQAMLGWEACKINS
jgi:AraC family transcriptional regulator, regulatory protein of adaptative response / methylated-DNA-[protein]-cysteine methyltransferase